MSEIKPCHRKCEAKLVIVKGEAPGMFWVRCQKCRTCGPCGKTKQEAINKWNEKR